MLRPRPARCGRPPAGLPGVLHGFLAALLGLADPLIGGLLNLGDVGGDRRGVRSGLLPPPATSGPSTGGLVRSRRQIVAARRRNAVPSDGGGTGRSDGND